MSFRRLTAHDLAIGSGPLGGEFGADDGLSGPLGADGLPVPLWDRLTGRVNKSVAQYWKTHSDLLYYTQNHWSEIGPSLIGKLHFYVGDEDDFHRNLGVRAFEEFLTKTTQPHYAGSFEFAPLKGNLWQPMTNAQLVGIVADYINKHETEGEGNPWDER